MSHDLIGFGKCVERCRLGRDAQYESFAGRLTEKLVSAERGAHAAALTALDVGAVQLLINGELYVRVVRG